MGTGRTKSQLGGGRSDTGPLTLMGFCWPGQHVVQAMVAVLELSRGVKTRSETPPTHPCLQGAAATHFRAISNGFAALQCSTPKTTDTVREVPDSSLYTSYKTGVYNQCYNQL